MCAMGIGQKKSDRATGDNQGIRVAIDGPVASGKTSVGRAVAQRLELRFLDTGIMYRAVTWLALRRQIAITDTTAVAAIARCCPISVSSTSASGEPSLSIDGYTPGRELWDVAVEADVSAVAAMSAVRTALVQQQRAISQQGNIVMVGRDICSVVLPDAEVKLYIDASVAVRARRRFTQRIAAATDANADTDADQQLDYHQVLADTKRRDSIDIGRVASPLAIDAGATVINTDGLTLEQTVVAVLDTIRAAVAASISESASKLTAAAGEG